MGLCYLVAGILYRKPRFDAGEAGHHSVLMMLTAAAVIFPSVGGLVMCGSPICKDAGQTHTLMTLSVGIAVVLLIAYACYVLFAVFGLESIRGRTSGSDSDMVRERAADRRPSAWPTWLSVAVLAGSTVLLIPVVDTLTASVEPVTHVLGWTQVFVGMVIVANAGNVAEGYAALRFAWTRGGVDPTSGDSGLDLALGIASASSIQIATFVAPLIVLYSLVGHNMTLRFSPVEMAILGLLVIIFAYIGHDGESNWLEGAELLALYAMAAIVFFVLPVGVFG
jgi:Ca2+:H+ antiporter